MQGKIEAGQGITDCARREAISGYAKEAGKIGFINEQFQYALAHFAKDAYVTDVENRLSEGGEKAFHN
jgi:hypothetical protein